MHVTDFERRIHHRGAAIREIDNGHLPSQNHYYSDAYKASCIAAIQLDVSSIIIVFDNCHLPSQNHLLY